MGVKALASAKNAFVLTCSLISSYSQRLYLLLLLISFYRWTNKSNIYMTSTSLSGNILLYFYYLRWRKQKRFLCIVYDGMKSNKTLFLPPGRQNWRTFLQYKIFMLFIKFTGGDKTFNLDYILGWCKSKLTVLGVLHAYRTVIYPYTVLAVKILEMSLVTVKKK